jgi:hypothetical protein
MELLTLVEAFAQGMWNADAARPVWVSQRSGRAYQPGIGPHAENAAVALTLGSMRSDPRFDAIPMGQFLPYPDAPRQKCDLWVGEPLEWAVEVKMARFRGDNGKPDDTALKDLLSPYNGDRSALSDARKLARSSLRCHKAVLVYGFEYADRPLEPAIAAFETLARGQVALGLRRTAAMRPLVHPIHAEGVVHAWEVSAFEGAAV